MSKNLPIALLVLTLVLAGCKKRSIPQTSSNIAVTVITDSLGVINLTTVDFLYFNSKSDFTFKDDKESLTASANLRVKTDSIIWLNITPGLGIEAMRGIITKDSLIFVDKIKKQYVVYDFATLSNKYKFPIDFKLLQDLLLGNPVKPQSSEDRITREASYYVLNQKIRNSTVESYINEKSLKVERVVFSEPGTSNILSVDYSAFKATEQDKIIPHTISLDLDYTFENKKYNISIDISHHKAEFSEKNLRFPFNIPAKYERKE